MVTIIQDLPDFSFSSTLPNLKFRTDFLTMVVKFYRHNEGEKEELFSEKFTVDKEGVIEITTIGELLEPYLEKKLNQEFSYRIVDAQEEVSKTFRVQYCRAEIDIPAAAFLKNFFLTTMQGDKSILLDTPEFIHFYEDTPSSVVAQVVYDVEGVIQKEEKILKTQTTAHVINTLEVSPYLLEKEGAKLIEYTIKADARSQRYIIDYQSVEARPRLLFTNSFGCQETFLCKGTLELESKITRSAGWVNSQLRNFDTQEERIYKANTGYMTPAVANWAEDLIRSKEIYLLNDRTPGKEIVIVDSKVNRSMRFDELPSFTFDYQLAQRNHNVLLFKEAGRIFDASFDITFN